MLDESPEAAERAVLGAILLRPDILDELTLAPGDFQDMRYGAVYGLMQYMRHSGRPIDAVTVCEAVRRSQDPSTRTLNDTDVHGWAASVPTPASAPYYEAIVVRAAVVRRLQSAKAHIDQAAASDMTAVELVEAARNAIDRVAGDVRVESHPIAEDMDDAIDALENPPTYYSTPWVDLNEMIGGFEPGRLYVFGARPGVGKSVVALQCALGLTEQGRVAFSSLEMSRNEILFRAISNGARISGVRLANRQLTSVDWQRIAAVDGILRAKPLFIDDRSSVTVSQVRQHARGVMRRGRLSGVIVDYLQLMRSERGEKDKARQEVVAEYSRQLKIMAKELDTPVLALSQLNRASTQRADKRPQLSDLRESGAVEQDADVVVLLHRELDDPDKEKFLHMYVAKNRSGPMGHAVLDFIGDLSKAETRRRP